VPDSYFNPFPALVFRSPLPVLDGAGPELNVLTSPLALSEEVSGSLRRLVGPLSPL